MKLKPKFIKVLNDSSIGLFVDEAHPTDRIESVHMHSEFELLFVNQGEAKILVGDYEGNLCRGDTILLGPKLSHRIVTVEGSRITSMYFNKHVILEQVHAIADLSKLDDLLKKADLGIRFIPSDKSIGSLIDSLKDTEGVDRVIALFQLFKNLLHYKQFSSLSSMGYSSGATDIYIEDRIRDVNEYIRGNLNKKITLDELAEVANMSSPAFSNFYRKKTRKTVFQQLNEMRIGHAKKLILQTDLTITEIAKSCGYPNTTFFNRQFKKLTNKSPTAYRKSYLEMSA